MKVGIAFSTKDRVELSRQSIAPLLNRDGFDLWLIDGSITEAGLDFATQQPAAYSRGNVCGGADAAIVYGLSALLESAENYTHIGLVENDVVLDRDWFTPTMTLFEQGRQDDLQVGAVSARCYQDRILIQRDGYAICHNLGAGMVIFTRTAAELVLKYFRTGFTLENRRIFHHLSGLDIGNWWAFRRAEQWITADWHFDAMLAAHGLASLALTPAKCHMVGQIPPLAEQGLVMADAPVSELCNDRAFEQYCCVQQAIHLNRIALPLTGERDPDGYQTVFPHELSRHDECRNGDWRLLWTQGFGPFSWRAEKAGAAVSWQLAGPIQIVLGGYKTGATALIHAGPSAKQDVEIKVPPEPHAMKLAVPGGIESRFITVVARTPGLVIHAIGTKNPQPTVTTAPFRHRYLPSV